MLREDKIQELQRLYKRRFGDDISHGEVLEIGTQLVELVSHIFRPVTTAEMKAALKRTHDFHR